MKGSIGKHEQEFIKKLSLFILILLLYKTAVFAQCTSSPTITGNTTPCQSGVPPTYETYSTEPGMTNYTWSVTNGYILTPGPPFSNSVIVQWYGLSGSSTVSVNYTDANGCRPTSPTVKSINVISLPIPTISGSPNVCLNSSGNIYTTESGQTNYFWAVIGGVVTAGAGTNSITITWNAEGSKEVRVRYTAPTGCTSNVASKIVIVNPVVPSISGNETACPNTNYTYSTQGGKSSYNWSVVGGNIISNNGNSVSVAWPSVGAKSISVSYIDPTGCNSNPVVTKNINVVNLPIPNITGNSSACQFDQTNVYTTEPGMSSYVWTFSNVSGPISFPAGHIISGTGTNSITVRWGGNGPQTIGVNYTNSLGCTAAQPTTLNVNVTSVPLPNIVSGPTTLCGGEEGVYTAPPGQQTYNWVVPGGTIISGAGTNSITAKWDYMGNAPVYVYLNYGTVSGCQTQTTNRPVNIRQTWAASINSSGSTLCSGNRDWYSTNSNFSSYSWTVSSGGTITPTEAPHTIWVTWNEPGPQSVSVSFTNPTGCAPIGVPVTKNVIVNEGTFMTSAETTTICSGSSINFPLTSTLPSVYFWTVIDNPNTVGETSGSANSTYARLTGGIINNNSSPETVVYTITPRAVGTNCSGPKQIFSVIVNPRPEMTSINTVTICSGENMNFPLASNVPSAFQWYTNSGSSSILGGSITPQHTSNINNTLTNNATSIQDIVYRVTPTSTLSCIGFPQYVTVSVKPKTVIQNFNTLPLKTYGNVPFTLSASNNSGLPITFSSSNPTIASVNGNILSIVSVGTAVITASHSGSATFCPANNVSQVLTINKATLTATPTNASRTYGAANPTFAINYTGFVNGENASVIDSPPVRSTTATLTSNTGTYPITVSGGTDNNYTFTYGAPATLTVTKAALTATSNATKVYGAANPAFPITYTGLMNGETAAVIDTQPTATTAATVLSNVGSYPITLTGGSDNNYTITNQAGSLSVTKKDLTAAAVSTSKYVGQPNPPFSINYTGFVNGENSSVLDVKPVPSTTATTSSPVGSYPINLSGGSDNNYAYTYVNGVLTVSPVPTCSFYISSTGDLCTEGRVQLRVNATSGTPATYLWSTGLTTSRIPIHWGGTYSVTVTFSNGCTQTQSIYIEDPVGPGCIYYLKAEPLQFLQTSEYPNPVDAELTIEIASDLLETNTTDIPVNLIDPTGKSAFTSSFKKDTNQIKISTQNMPAGLYVLQIGSGKTGVVRKKVMVVH